MKLKCSKCSTLLTQDLYYQRVSFDKHGYLTKGSLSKIHTSDHGISYSQQEKRMKKGLFYIRKASPAYNRDFEVHGILNYFQVVKASEKRIVVGERSFLEGVIPPFKSGYGCCNYNMGEELFCECGNLLGEMYLDCFEDGGVGLRDSGVRRVY